MREAAEAEVSAAALRVLWAMCLAYDAACLPFGMVGELRRKLSPIALAVLLLFMGVGMMNIRVSAEFPSSASVLHSSNSAIIHRALEAQTSHGTDPGPSCR